MRTAALALALVAACVKAPARPVDVRPADSTADELALRQRVHELLEHARAVLKARDEAVWQFWLGGRAVSMDEVWAGHEALLKPEALSTLRRVRERHQPVLPDALLDGLEAFIIGERVSRAAAEANTTVANLEASLHFPFEGRDVQLRDLNALLAAEKVAPRRAALWQASLPAVKQLDGALARRDEVTRQALEAVGSSPLALGRLLRGTDLGAAAEWSDRFLTATEQRWKARLATARASSRADLPALLKPSAAQEAAFPQGKIAERGTQLLANLRLYGLPGITLDLNDSPRKQPLPLTVANGGIRLTFKPRGGWKDQTALLAELGRALALAHAPPAELPLRRRAVEATAVLFGSLASTPAWLEEQGVPPVVAASIAELARDVRLFNLRRAAGAVLTEASTGPDGVMPAAPVDRALGFADDPARTRLEVEPLFASIEPLRANAHAEALRRHLEVEAGPRWWSNEKTPELLKAYWQSDALPEGVRGVAANAEALLAALDAPLPGGLGKDSPLP